MLLIKWRKFVYLVLSFALLLGAAVPHVPLLAYAEELGSPVKGSTIAAGVYHSLALKSDGTVAAWGWNSDGQNDVPAGLTGVVAIAGGGFFSLALRSDGTVVAWGADDSGQTDVPEGLSATAIAGGDSHALALKSDGTVVAWGRGSENQTTIPPGLAGVVAIAAGTFHSLAVKSDGTVVGWGYSVYGQTNAPDGLTGVISVAAGSNHSLALKSDGTVVAWGANDSGQSDVPEGLAGVIAIAAKENFSLALKSDGTVVAWGANDYGQTDVPEGLAGVVAIAAGRYHSLAMKSDGTLIGWGYDFEGIATAPGKDNLGNLALQEGSFTQRFSGSVTSYTAYIRPSVSSVNLTATLADTRYSALYVNNELQASGSAVTVSVSGASTDIFVRVEPYFKPAKTYTITVKRDDTPPIIQFDTNGNDSPAKTASSKVTVNDTESGVDTASLQYAWTQSAEVPDSGWKSFKTGNTLSLTSEDGDRYLHVRASDRAGNVANAVSQAFVLDNTKPTAILSSSAGGTVNGAFPVTVTFSEPVNSFGDGGIAVGNGAISDVAAVAEDKYTATITPITNGQATTVQVKADAALDAAGNGNEASNIMSFMYDTTKPAVTFDGFTNNQIFTAPPRSVSVKISEAVYRMMDGNEVGASDAEALLHMEKDGQPFADYTTNYDSGSHTFTLTFNDTLGEGAYRVMVAGDTVWNAGHNTLDAASANFNVIVPRVTGISVDPANHPYSGGDTTVSITGVHLSGQKLEIYVDGTRDATAAINSDTNAEATVTFPANSSGNAKSYDLTVYLNGDEIVGQSATVTVERAASGANQGASHSSRDVAVSFINLNGISLDPAQVDVTKLSVMLEAAPKDGMAYVSIPAAVLSRFADRNAGFIIEIKTPYGSYQVPVNLASLIPELNGLLAADNLTTDDISFKITLTDKSGDKAVQAALAGSLSNGKAIGAMVDFHLEIVNAKTGQTIGIADRFSEPLTRIIPMPKDLNSMPAQWGAFRYNEAEASFDFVPSLAVQIDGAWYAMIRSYTNSLYVVAENTVNFADVQKHWSEPYVRLAAAKGLVSGVGSEKFAPDKAVSRAEFTAMLVNAVGRGKSLEKPTSPYDDVQVPWYFDAVDQAKKLGLLDFVSGSSFKPDEPLTREEMASMLAAALRHAKLPVSNDFVSLESYKDFNKIDAAYLENIRLIVKLNIMTGTGGKTFDPKGVTTRAQAAIVLIKTLQSLGWIDR